MHIIYRISDAGHKKVKPAYINNKKCLQNALSVFSNSKWKIIADNTSEETDSYIPSEYIQKVNQGNGAKTFNLALDYALSLPDDEIVYFLENDYLHKPNSEKILEQVFSLNPSFVSLYDHPDKYIEPKNGGNPHCEGRSEKTRVYISNYCHWKITNSTTMTFASKVSTLKKTESIFRKYSQGTYPHDFHIFSELKKMGYITISPIPSLSTHGESRWLAPFVEWSSL